MCMTLGGRVAEDIVFGRVSTGAQNDLERITKMAYAMVSIYGMNEKVGNVSFYDPNNEYGFTKPYSDKTAEMIDVEVRKMIDECYVVTKELLIEKREKLEELSQILLKREILFQHDLEEILGKRPFDPKHIEDTTPIEEVIEEIKTEQEGTESSVTTEIAKDETSAEIETKKDESTENKVDQINLNL